MQPRSAGFQCRCCPPGWEATRRGRKCLTRGAKLGEAVGGGHGPPTSMADTSQPGSGLQGGGTQLSKGRGPAHLPPCCQGPLRDSPQAPPGSSTHPHPCLEPTRWPKASPEEVRQKERRTEKESPLNFLPQTRLHPKALETQ